MGLSNYGVLDRQPNDRERWGVFWALFAFAGICMYVFCKLNAVLAVLAPMYGMDVASMGLIMSVATVTGVVFAFPIAWIMRKIGVKASLLITAATMIIGSAICLMSADMTSFLIGRFFEGSGFGFIAVIGPNVMPRIFPVEKLGIAMGIWSLWVTPGIILGALLTPVLFTSGGPGPLFISSLALEAIGAVIVAVFVKMPKTDENTIVKGNVARKRVFGKAYVMPAILVAIMFIIYNIGYGAFNNFYPSFLQMESGWDIQASALLSLLVALCTVPAGFLFGKVIDKKHNAKHFIWIGFVVMAIMYGTWAWAPGCPSWAIVVFAVILGFVCAAAVPVGSRTIIPILTKEPEKTDYVLALMAFGSQLGSLLCGIICSPLIAMVGFYNMSLYLLVPLCVLAAIIVLLFVPSDKKVFEEETTLQEQAS